MIRHASNSTRRSPGHRMPAAGAAPLRSPVLFEGRVPEFAQAGWLALQKANVELDAAPKKTGLPTQKIYTYAVMEDGLPAVLLFFRLEKREAIVLNEAEQAAGQELRDFSRYVFHRFPRVRRIRFQAQHRFIQPEGRRFLRRPCRLALLVPPSMRLEEALRFNRRNITYFLQRLKREHPDFHIECHVDADIPPSQCRALLRLNRPQAADGSPAAGAPDDEENLIRAAQQAGMVCVLKIGGRIAAGTICLRRGGEWQLRFLAHDPRLQAYGLGMLCCYFTVCEHIDRQRAKAGKTLSRPRYRHALEVRQHCISALTLHRPHASWLVRCDCAIYGAALGLLQRMIALRDGCVQAGQAFARLAAAWKGALQALKKRPSPMARLSALPAQLRGQ